LHPDGWQPEGRCTPQDLELPAATGTTNGSKTASIGGVLQVTVKGMFTVTQTR
jgi:hypothetical protein